MTKRVSQVNPVVVPAAAVPVTAGKAAVVAVAAAAVDADVAEKAVTTAEEGDAAAVVALSAPAPLAMVAEAPAQVAQDGTTTATAATTTQDTASTGAARDVTPFIVGGVLLAGGILAVALSGDNDDNQPAPTPTPPATPTQTVAISTPATASVAENTAGGPTGNVVIDVNAASTPAGGATAGAITYTLSGPDASFFTINSSTGEVRFVNSPNFEAARGPTYNITVTATAAASGGAPAATAQQNITVTVTNVNEPPTFANATATATVVENAAVGTPVFTAQATDPDAGTVLTYTLGGPDATLFTINPTTGAVSLRAPADFETRPSYTFTVTATDNATPALSATQTVTLNVTNVNEPPVFAQPTRAVSVPENTPATTPIITAGGATDPDAGAVITYSLTGPDAALFAVNPQTGAVTFRASPDFETPRSAAGTNVYSFNLVATDQGGLTATQANTVTVTDVPDTGGAQVSIDAAGAAATFDAGAGSFTFVDNAALPNATVINNFSNNDRILVTNQPAGTTFSFTTLDNDLIISFNNAGTVSRITINDVVSPNAFVFDEASAEAAVGFDFFRYG